MAHLRCCMCAAWTQKQMDYLCGSGPAVVSLLLLATPCISYLHPCLMLLGIHCTTTESLQLHKLELHNSTKGRMTWGFYVQGTTFSAMLGDMLEAVRWPQDPSSTPGSPFGRGGVAKGGKPESPSATRIRVPVGQIGTSTLAPHPTRQLFLTGNPPTGLLLLYSLSRTQRTQSCEDPGTCNWFVQVSTRYQT